jgi:hypothetical protein
MTEPYIHDVRPPIPCPSFLLIGEYIQARACRSLLIGPRCVSLIISRRSMARPNTRHHKDTATQSSIYLSKITPASLLPHFFLPLPLYFDRPRRDDLMKFRLHPSIPNSIYLQLEAQPGAVDNHLEREIEVIELHAPCGRQPREQTPGHSV